MSYDLIKSVQHLIELQKGDVGRLEYILDTLKERKYLYLSDQKYLENLLQEAQNEEREKDETIHNNVVINELKNEIRNLREKLDKIETEKINPNKETKVGDQKREKITQKNEVVTLALSIVLGLVSLSGVGHMYLGKYAKGIGILVISFISIGSGITLLIIPVPLVSPNLMFTSIHLGA
ncbi:MAG: hypothetical protein ACRD32_01855, partial [Nitrososphaerales archaeon]